MSVSSWDTLTLWDIIGIGRVPVGQEVYRKVWLAISTDHVGYVQYFYGPPPVYVKTYFYNNVIIITRETRAKGPIEEHRIGNTLSIDSRYNIMIAIVASEKECGIVFRSRCVMRRRPQNFFHECSNPIYYCRKCSGNRY